MLPLGGSLVTSCNDGVIRCFDVATGGLLRQTGAHGAVVQSIHLSHDDQRMVTVSTDKKVRIYDVRTFVEQLRFSHSEDMHHAFFIDDDRRLLVCDANFVTVVNPATGQTVLKLGNAYQTHIAAAIDCTGSMLVVPKDNGLVFLRLRIE